MDLIVSKDFNFVSIIACILPLALTSRRSSSVTFAAFLFIPRTSQTSVTTALQMCTWTIRISSFLSLRSNRQRHFVLGPLERYTLCLPYCCL